MSVWRKFLACWVFVILGASAGWGNQLQKEYETRFTKYFTDRIQAKSVLSVIMASEDELRRGKIPTLNLCIENAVVERVRYDRLLLVMHDVLFTSPARGIVIHSHGECHISGGISKESFLKTLSEGMPHFTVSELELRNGTVMVKGVYERRLTFRVRALMRFTGSYVIDGNGVAKVRFDDATNDNPTISSLDVARAMANAASVLSFREFFGAPLIREVLVDHDMVWFSARNQ